MNIGNTRKTRKAKHSIPPGATIIRAITMVYGYSKKLPEALPSGDGYYLYEIEDNPGTTVAEHLAVLASCEDAELSYISNVDIEGSGSVFRMRPYEVRAIDDECEHLFVEMLCRDDPKTAKTRDDRRRSDFFAAVKAAIARSKATNTTVTLTLPCMGY